MASLWQAFVNRQDQLINSLIEHIQLSFIALILATLIAIPLGIWLTRKEKIAEGVIGATAVLQTIPSLALLGLLIPLLGIGKTPATIALVAYALLPILRNTYTGLKEVDPSLTEAARAMGMKPRQLLFKIEFPLAMPIIMAGIRTAMVLIVGTATLAALIGAGGLGDIILLGIDRNNSALILLGAIPAALLAILFDVLLRKFERMSFKKSMATLGAIFVVTLLMIVVPFVTDGKKDKLIIAGKLGAEPEILINMYKILIEENSELTVELEPGLGKTSFLFNALREGSIDIYPEFTGTAISEFLKETAVNTDREEVYHQAKTGLEEFDLILLDPMDFNNTYALAVTEDVANQYDLSTITDLKEVAENIHVGFTLEFADREDGYIGLQQQYGLTFPHLTTMEPKLRYQAIEANDIHLIDAYSTDSEIEEYDLVVLEDDQKLFPPYQGAPLLRRETVERYPEVVEALQQLAGKITDDEMREMNYRVNVEGIPPNQIAEEYLQKVGLY